MTKREGKSSLRHGESLALRGDFDGALGEYREAFRLFPKSPVGDAALLESALIYADFANPGRDPRKALTLFKNLIADFPESEFMEGARKRVDALEKSIRMHDRLAEREKLEQLLRNGDFDGALREYLDILTKFPRSPQGDEALYAVGHIYADNSYHARDAAKALTFFKRLVNDFPDSEFRRESLVRIRILEKEVKELDDNAELQKLKQLLRKGDFDGALRECRNMLANSSRTSPADEALYYMGLIYLDRNNPKMDYRKALPIFARLRREFPGSSLSEEARIWIDVLETVEKALQIDITIEEKTKELRR